MKIIEQGSGINNAYEKGSNILQNNSKFNAIEVEVYKIIFNN